MHTPLSIFSLFILPLPLALSLPTTPPLSLPNESTYLFPKNAILTLQSHNITIPPLIPLITKALAYAHTTTDPQAYNHVVRSWLNTLTLHSNLPASDPRKKSFDLEALSIAAILHDLGWSLTDPNIITQNHRFEVDGADAAVNFLKKEGKKSEWPPSRLQLVWDTIALHTTPSLALYKQPIIAFTSAGINADVLGLTPILHPTSGSARELNVSMTETQYRGVAAAFPKSGFKEYLNGTLCGLCVRKPESTWDNFVGEWGVEWVSGYTLEGKTVLDAWLGTTEGV